VNKNPAQNLVEFIFVLPILLVLTLVIFELALFWQDVNSIYNLNAEVNANAALADTSNMAMGTECTAATKALAFFKTRDSMISLNDPTYTKEIVQIAGAAQGSEPFALYKFSSSPVTVNTQVDDGAGGTVFEEVTRPQVALWVDCRSPFEKGITTQIEFFHKNLIMRATIPNFNGGLGIVVIPDKEFIASPKLNTLRHY